MNNIKSVAFIILMAAVGLVSPVSAQSYSPNHERVKKHFQSNAERTAKDATWTARSIFKVGVINDGTSRNGYASYICQVLYDYGFRGKRVWVQVIDIVKLVRNNRWVKLGQARCQ